VVCRVKARLKVKDRVFEGRALLNSGFEADTPDIIVPVHIARDLKLWPPSTEAVVTLETGGGEVTLPYYTSHATLELMLPDKRSKIVNVNIIVSPYVDEVILKLSKPRLLRRGRVINTQLLSVKAFKPPGSMLLVW
jgi:hypothetical protein